MLDQNLEIILLSQVVYNLKTSVFNGNTSVFNTLLM